MFNERCFTACEALEKASPNATKHAFNEINKAIEKGAISCYVNIHTDRIPVVTVIELVKKMFDIKFTHFVDNDDWFVEACWADNACGRIYQKKHNVYNEISLEEFISLLKKGKRRGYLIEINDEEKNKLLEQEIKYEVFDSGVIIESFDAYTEALIILGKFEPEFGV